MIVNRCVKLRELLISIDLLETGTIEKLMIQNYGQEEFLSRNEALLKIPRVVLSCVLVI